MPCATMRSLTMRRGRPTPAAPGASSPRTRRRCCCRRRGPRRSSTLWWSGGRPGNRSSRWSAGPSSRACGSSVDPGVFVPRRRSEFLVSVAVGLAGWRTDGGEIPVIVDLCCGTGALGLAVANGLAGWAGLHAADLDPAAVACARRNVEPAGGRVYVGDLFGALPDGLRGRADILICNAPYVPTGDVAFLPGRGARPRAAGRARRRPRRARDPAPGRVGRARLARARRRAAGGDERPAGPGDGGRDGRGRPLPVHPHRRRLGRHRRHRPSGQLLMRVGSGQSARPGRGPGARVVREAKHGSVRDNGVRPCFLAAECLEHP